MFESHEIRTSPRTRGPVIDITGIVWKRRWLALGAFFVAIILVLAAAIAITPTFEASSLLVVDQSTIDSSRDTKRSGGTGALLARIAESDDVIRKAIDQVGLEKLVGPRKKSWTKALSDLVVEAQSYFFGAHASPVRRVVTELELAVPTLGKALAIRPMPNNDVIRISFWHKDPVTAAAFVNAVAQVFVDRQLDLFSRPGVAAFYQRQKDKFEDDIRRASDALHTFETSQKAYSIDDQKELLLKRASEVATALAATRGAIADKAGQREALTAQLRKLKPVTLSPFVASVVDAFGSPLRPETDAAKAVSRRSTSLDLSRVSEEPPLLMVRVYQDSMVALFKINAELNGLEGLQHEQAQALQELNGTLDELSAKEAEFARLKRAVAQASLNSDTYVKRMVEEQITAESNAARLSALKIVQQAYPPPKPGFPSYPLLAGLGLVLSVLFALAVALGVDAFLRPARVEEPRLRSPLPVQIEARTKKNGRATKEANIGPAAVLAASPPPEPDRPALAAS
jgi:uncharacterized protein involved in exopolysaccharide biosynthesis